MMMALARWIRPPDTRPGAVVGGSDWREGRDDADYTWLFRNEFAAVVRTAYLIVHDRQEAEDVAQEAFTRLLVHWRRVSRYDRPDAWVRRVAIRLAVRHVRRAQLRSGIQRAVDDDAVDPSVVDPDLVQALRALPPRQRAAVALFYFEDRPTSEIAQILNCSTATVKVHLFKARKRLADLLGEGVTDVP
jgi:RNA polymerase sigma-70 factor (sigma-E family)